MSPYSCEAIAFPNTENTTFGIIPKSPLMQKFATIIVSAYVALVFTSKKIVKQQNTSNPSRIPNRCLKVIDLKSMKKVQTNDNALKMLPS